MMSEYNDEDILTTLHYFQKACHLCDVNLVSHDGQQFFAHAGVLAASSSILEKELSKCDCGNYTIILPLNYEETHLLIEFAYTGHKKRALASCSDELSRFCDEGDSRTHAEKVLRKLHEYSENGLFCNMDWYPVVGDVYPGHAFLLAAKFDFLSRHIRTGSLVTVHVSEKPEVDIRDIPEVAVHGVHEMGGGEVDPQAVLPYGSYIWSEKNVTLPPVIAEQVKNRKKDYYLDYKTHQCDTCLKWFATKGSLNTHKRVHFGPRSLECEICHKHFKKLTHLQRHELVHTDVKPYECDICQRRFKTLDYMKKHELIHTDNKPYECGTCNKQFVRLPQLKSHELVHTHVKNFTCEVCLKRFARLGDLKRHELVHGDKQYMCEICHRPFARVDYLKKHELTHTRKENNDQLE